jgi:hypothetical protein
METFNEKYSEALKIKTSKTRWSLLPWAQLQEPADLITKGALDYGDYGWQNNPRSYYEDAIFRHLTAYMSGEKNDPKSGSSHIAHVMCNAMFIQWHLDKEKTDGQS